MSLFGMLLNELRARRGAVGVLFFLCLAGLVGANVFIRPHEAEFADATRLGPCSASSEASHGHHHEKIVQPMISREMTTMSATANFFVHLGLLRSCADLAVFERQGLEMASGRS
jgi:hypothetical protein